MSKTTNFSTGAVRSADANHLDLTSLPLIGLIAVARTSVEGGTKYGRYNYMRGMSARDSVNHTMRHMVMWLLGDRSEPHLSHGSWGLMNAEQSMILNPELNEAELLGPGATLGPEMLRVMAEQDHELKRRREAGDFDDIGKWSMYDIPEIQTILAQRRAVRETEAQLAKNRDEAAGFQAMIRDVASVPADDSVAKRPALRKETLRQWCERNPMASDVITADSLGLSATGCPEPFASFDEYDALDREIDAMLDMEGCDRGPHLDFDPFAEVNRDWPNSDTPFAEVNRIINDPANPVRLDTGTMKIVPVVPAPSAREWPPLRNPRTGSHRPEGYFGPKPE